MKKKKVQVTLFFQHTFKSLKHEFSVIGIAETNILKSNKDLYKINDNYTSVYSSKIEDKTFVAPPPAKKPGHALGFIHI